MVGVLQDKDRIFTNLYGLHSWRLPAARARGAWDGTKDMIARGHEAVINEDVDQRTLVFHDQNFHGHAFMLIASSGVRVSPCPRSRMRTWRLTSDFWNYTYP